MVGLRCVLSAVVCDQVSRKLFVNYTALRNHKIADYEVRKVMRTFPSAQPYIPLHKRANSYILV